MRIIQATGSHFAEARQKYKKTTTTKINFCPPLFPPLSRNLRNGLHFQTEEEEEKRGPTSSKGGSRDRVGKKTFSQREMKF